MIYTGSQPGLPTPDSTSRYGSRLIAHGNKIQRLRFGRALTYPEGLPTLLLLDISAGTLRGKSMRIPSFIKSLYTAPIGPQIERNELFQRDGWGPAQPAWKMKPHRYRGPSYPLPMHPTEVPNTTEGARLCNAARKAWSLKSMAEAEANYRAAIKLAPKNPDFRFELAQLLWCDDRYDEAMSILGDVLEIDQQMPQALVSLTRLHRSGGDIVNALKALNTLILSHRANWPVQLALTREVGAFMN